MLQRATASGILGDADERTRPLTTDPLHPKSKTPVKSKKSKSQRRASGASVRRKSKSAKTVAFGSSAPNIPNKSG